MKRPVRSLDAAEGRRRPPAGVSRIEASPSWSSSGSSEAKHIESASSHVTTGRRHVVVERAADCKWLARTRELTEWPRLADDLQVGLGLEQLLEADRLQTAEPELAESLVGDLVEADHAQRPVRAVLAQRRMEGEHEVQITGVGHRAEPAGLAARAFGGAAGHVPGDHRAQPTVSLPGGGIVELRVGAAAGERLGAALRRVGVGAVAGAIRPPGTRVILMHGIAAAEHGALRALLERLLRRMRCAGPRELIPGGPAAELGTPAFSLTFDDGLLSTYAATGAVLDELGVKAAFFIPTEILGLRTEQQMRDFRSAYLHGPVGSLAAADVRVMGAEQLAELATRGHAVFPHTHTHMALAEIAGPELIDRELRRPRALIEDIVGEPANALAFPYGDDRSIGREGFAAAAGLYDACFTAIPGLNTAGTDRRLLRRDAFDPSDAVSGHAENLLSGALDGPYAMKMWRLRRRAGLS